MDKQYYRSIFYCSICDTREEMPGERGWRRTIPPDWITFKTRAYTDGTRPKSDKYICNRCIVLIRKHLGPIPPTGEGE